MSQELLDSFFREHQQDKALEDLLFLFLLDDAFGGSDCQIERRITSQDLLGHR